MASSLFAMLLNNAATSTSRDASSSSNSRGGTVNDHQSESKLPPSFYERRKYDGPSNACLDTIRTYLYNATRLSQTPPVLDAAAAAPFDDDECFLENRFVTSCGIGIPCRKQQDHRFSSWLVKHRPFDTVKQMRSSTTTTTQFKFSSTPTNSSTNTRLGSGSSSISGASKLQRGVYGRRGKERARNLHFRTTVPAARVANSSFLLNDNDMNTTSLATCSSFSCPPPELVQFVLATAELRNIFQVARQQVQQVLDLETTTRRSSYFSPPPRGQDHDAKESQSEFRPLIVSTRNAHEKIDLEPLIKSLGYRRMNQYDGYEVEDDYEPLELGWDIILEILEQVVICTREVQMLAFIFREPDWKYWTVGDSNSRDFPFLSDALWLVWACLSTYNVQTITATSAPQASSASESIKPQQIFTSSSEKEEIKGDEAIHLDSAASPAMLPEEILENKTDKDSAHEISTDSLTTPTATVMACSHLTELNPSNNNTLHELEPIPYQEAVATTEVGESSVLLQLTDSPTEVMATISDNYSAHEISTDSLTTPAASVTACTELDPSNSTTLHELEPIPYQGSVATTEVGESSVLLLLTDSSTEVMATISDNSEVATQSAHGWSGEATVAQPPSREKQAKRKIIDSPSTAAGLSSEFLGTELAIDDDNGTHSSNQNDGCKRLKITSCSTSVAAGQESPTTGGKSPTIDTTCPLAKLVVVDDVIPPHVVQCEFANSLTDVLLNLSSPTRDEPPCHDSPDRQLIDSSDEVSLNKPSLDEKPLDKEGENGLSLVAGEGEGMLGGGASTELSWDDSFDTTSSMELIMTALTATSADSTHGKADVEKEQDLFSVEKHDNSTSADSDAEKLNEITIVVLPTSGVGTEVTVEDQSDHVELSSASGSATGESIGDKENVSGLLAQSVVPLSSDPLSAPPTSDLVLTPPTTELPWDTSNVKASLGSSLDEHDDNARSSSFIDEADAAASLTTSSKRIDAAAVSEIELPYDAEMDCQTSSIELPSTHGSTPSNPIRESLAHVTTPSTDSLINKSSKMSHGSSSNAMDTEASSGSLTERDEITVVVISNTFNGTDTTTTEPEQSNNAEMDLSARINALDNSIYNNEKIDVHIPTPSFRSASNWPPILDFDLTPPPADPILMNSDSKKAAYSFAIENEDNVTPNSSTDVEADVATEAMSNKSLDAVDVETPHDTEVDVLAYEFAPDEELKDEENVTRVPTTSLPLQADECENIAKADFQTDRAIDRSYSASTTSKQHEMPHRQDSTSCSDQKALQCRRSKRNEINRRLKASYKVLDLVVAPKLIPIRAIKLPPDRGVKPPGDATDLESESYSVCTEPGVAVVDSALVVMEDGKEQQANSLSCGQSQLPKQDKIFQDDAIHSANPTSWSEQGRTTLTNTPTTRGFETPVDSPNKEIPNSVSSRRRNNSSKMARMNSPSKVQGLESFSADTKTPSLLRFSRKPLPVHQSMHQDIVPVSAFPATEPLVSPDLLAFASPQPGKQGFNTKVSRNKVGRPRKSSTKSAISQSTAVKRARVESPELVALEVGQSKKDNRKPAPASAVKSNQLDYEAIISDYKYRFQTVLPVDFGRSISQAKEAVTVMLELHDKDGELFNDEEYNEEIRMQKQSFRILQQRADQERLESIRFAEEEQLRQREDDYYNRRAAPDLYEEEMERLCSQPIQFVSNEVWEQAKQEKCLFGPDCKICGNGGSKALELANLNIPSPSFEESKLKDVWDAPHDPVDLKSTSRPRRRMGGKLKQALLMLNEMQHTFNFIEEYNMRGKCVPKQK